MGKAMDFIVKTVKSIIDNDFSGMAAEMSYMLVIGIFPFMLFLMSLFTMIGKHYFMSPLFLFMDRVMPGDSLCMIRGVLSQVLGFQKGGAVAVAGLLATMFMSMNALSVVIKGLNRAYKAEETRPFLYTRLLSLVMVVVNTLVLFLSINTIIFGKVIVRFLITYMSLSQYRADIMLAVRWPIAFLALFCMAFLHYYIFPDVSWSDTLKRKVLFQGLYFSA